MARDTANQTKDLSKPHADGHVTKSKGRIPFILSVEERDFVRAAAEAAYGAEFIEGVEPTAHELMNDAVPVRGGLTATSSKFARPDGGGEWAEICLCSGLGPHLIETLVEASWNKPEMSKAAEALVVRILGVMSEEPESSTLGPSDADERTGEPDQTPEWIVENIYRIGIGMPIKVETLGQRQYERISSEANTFASALGCEIEEYEREGHHGIVFTDKGTGGRPRRIGAVELVNPDTFEAALIFMHGPARGPWGLGDSLFDERDIRRNLMSMALSYKANTTDKAGQPARS